MCSYVWVIFFVVLLFLPINSVSDSLIFLLLFGKVDLQLMWLDIFHNTLLKTYTDIQYICEYLYFVNHWILLVCCY